MFRILQNGRTKKIDSFGIEFNQVFSQEKLSQFLSKLSQFLTLLINLSMIKT